MIDCNSRVTYQSDGMIVHQAVGGSIHPLGPLLEEWLPVGFDWFVVRLVRESSLSGGLSPPVDEWGL